MSAGLAPIRSQGTRVDAFRLVRGKRRACIVALSVAVDLEVEADERLREPVGRFHRGVVAGAVERQRRHLACDLLDRVGGEVS